MALLRSGLSGTVLVLRAILFVAHVPITGDRAMVIVDEAYIDFARDGKGSCSGVSACQLLDKHANVIVLQTLSKAFGLAGIRCVAHIGVKSGRRRQPIMIVRCG